MCSVDSNNDVLVTPTTNRCHGRILENIIDAHKLIQFDALSHHKKYSDIFDYDDVPEDERKEVARSIAAWVLESLDNASAQKGPEGGDPKGSRRSCCG